MSDKKRKRKGRALRKDLFMEIKNNIGRFLSIFVIVALGVALFAGIRGTKKDMTDTGDAYADDGKLADLKVVSAAGFTEDDIKSMRGLSRVGKVVGTKSLDALCETDDEKKVIRVMTVTDDINRLSLSSGRFPKKNGECVMDEDFLQSSDFKIGDKITLTGGEGNSLTDSVKHSEFKIVGGATSPLYFASDRGSSMVGDGTADAFMAVREDEFLSDVYTEAYVAVNGAAEKSAFTDEYDSLTEDAADKISRLGDERVKIRVEEILASRAAARDSSSAESLSGASDPAQREMTGAAGISASGRSGQALSLASGGAAIGEEELSEYLTWRVSDRGSFVADYEGFGENADRVSALSLVFPSIFFLVAALISLTAMTRMIDDERLQIGALKALGYGKGAVLAKYLSYAVVATVGGGLFGFAIGGKLFPFIIIEAYKTVFYRHIPQMVLVYPWADGILAILAALACTCGAVLFSCYRSLSEQPAALMRPKAPKSGKRILLERVKFIWKRLGFMGKATMRNIFRYKKRFFMTLFGVGGCMALVIVGFGLRDSINDIARIQYDSLQLYDAAVYLKPDATDKEAPSGSKTGGETSPEPSSESLSSAETQSAETQSEKARSGETSSELSSPAGTTSTESSPEDQVADFLRTNEDVEAFNAARFESATAKSGDGKEDVTVVTLKDKKSADGFFLFRSRRTKEEYRLTNDGVILTEKAAAVLGVKKGENIKISRGDEKAAKVKVTDVCENYVGHFVYMTEKCYADVFGGMSGHNVILLEMKPDAALKNEESAKVTCEELLKSGNVLSVQYSSGLGERISKILTALDKVIVVLVTLAGMLFFAVLYNLNNINITERRRELATLKVLGFHDFQVAAYIYRENIILTVFGMVLGCLLGKLLHYFTIKTVEIDTAMFGRDISAASYLIGAAATVVFSLIVNAVMYFNVKRIDMVESLKSIE